MKYKHSPTIRLPHMLTVMIPFTMGELDDMADWCAENFGPRARLTPHDPKALDSFRWMALHNTFYFRDIGDATLFRMKWS